MSFLRAGFMCSFSGDRFWFLFWLVFSSAWCITSATQLGATADEPPYIWSGLDRWHSGSYQVFMNMGTMPLSADLQTFPLYLAEFCRGRPFVREDDLHVVLPYARAMTLFFWWGLLIYSWKLTKHLATSSAARLALSFIACEPTLLAHASLATTDIALTTCLVALSYHFYVARDSSWFHRVGAPSFCFGLLLLAKSSGIVFGPICLLVLGLYWIFRNPIQRQKFRSLFVDAFQVVLLGFLFALLYCGSDWRPSTSLSKWAQGFQSDSLRDFTRYLADWPLYPNAAEGILWQVCQNSAGTKAYLLGQVHEQGVWYYFPLALSMKISLVPFALLILCSFSQWRHLCNPPSILAFSLLALSCFCRVQNGVRILLPFFVLLLIGLTVALSHLFSTITFHSRRLYTLLLSVIVGSSLLNALFVWPNGLCYFNLLWGGTSQGYSCLNDSNYDWGQGLKQLDRWHQRAGRPPLMVWTFGNDTAFRSMPVRQMQLGDILFTNQAHFESLVAGHYVAVSLLHLHGYSDSFARRYLLSSPLHSRTPTYFIFDFTQLRPVPTKPGS